MKCLDCRQVKIEEHGFNGFLGETLIACKICNEINGEMIDCEDFEEKSRRVNKVNEI